MKNKLDSVILSLVVCVVISCITTAAAQTETVLYSFVDGKDDAPQYVLYSNGSLFGTASGYRGDGHRCCGDVYKLSQSQDRWAFTSVYQFAHDSGGRLPNPGLVEDANGNLYGTTIKGGTGRRGTVFELPSSGGVPDFIWDFGNRKRDGGFFPQPGNLILDSSGSLYGEAYGGRHGFGVVFEISQSGGSWTETDLYDFKGGKDGVEPYGGLYMDRPGSLWGVTPAGGGQSDDGTVFHLVQSGGTWAETVIHRFGKGTDGDEPQGPLLGDSEGNLYGTTSYGGNFNQGTVFEIESKKEGGWRERVIYNFCPRSGCSDGQEPFAGLTWGTDNNTLYGTTAAGGDADYGTVFSLTNSGGSWSENVVYGFQGERARDGSGPIGPVVVDGSGNIYGTTLKGGGENLGTVWEITP